MSKENLPLLLWEKHREEIGLADPLVVDGDAELFTERSAPAPSAVIFLPKSKALIDMTLALVSGKVARGGTIVLVGSNDGGIGSAKKAYEANIGPVEKKIVGNHSAMYVGKNARLGAEKRLEDFLSFSPLSYSGPAGKTDIEVAHLPGVFSADELDEGTKLLLDSIPYREGRILDIGCGAGVIGALYKRLSPKSGIVMSDASLLAVRAAQETAARNELQATVLVSDVFDAIEGEFDTILCNPPFHSGVSTDYSFIEKFAKDAKKHLRRGGEIYVVANSFLPYKQILERSIGPTDIVADDRRFSVYRSKANG